MKVKRGNYSLCWDFIKESKNQILFISLVFLVFIVIGFAFPVFFLDYMRQMLQELYFKTAGMNFIQLFVFILQNNITTSLIGMFLGIIFGILPILLIAFNGYVLGFVMTKSAEIVGPLELLKLFPHGVFEIPAVLVSLGMGLKIGMFIFEKKKKKAFLHSLENSIRVFLFVVIPLLVIAALIETWLIFAFR